MVTRGVSSPPTECFADSECNVVDSCCFDTCLGHRVCKTADLIVGSGHGGLGPLGIGRVGLLGSPEVELRTGFQPAHGASSGHVQFKDSHQEPLQNIHTSTHKKSGKIKFQD